MSEIFTSVFDVIGKVRKATEECENKQEGFEVRAEDGPTLFSQGVTQALTFYLYKVGDLKKLENVYCTLFNDEGTCKELNEQNDKICSYLDNEGYALYTAVLLHFLRKLEVKCEVTNLSNDVGECVKDVSAKEAKIYRKLIEHMIELKKVSKIMIGQVSE